MQTNFENMKIKILSKILIAMLFVGLIPLGASATSGGQWVLINTQYQLGYDVYDDYQPNRQVNTQQSAVSAEERSATVHSFVSSSQYGDADLRTRWSWSAPPQTIRPDQAVEIEVQAETLSKTGSNWGFSHQLFIQSLSTPDPLWDFNVVEPTNLPRTDYLAIHHAGTGNVQGSGTYIMSRAFDDSWGANEPFIEVRVGTGAMPTVYRVKYLYEWRERVSADPTEDKGNNKDDDDSSGCYIGTLAPGK